MTDYEFSPAPFSRLTETHIERIQAASLEILESIGVRLHLQEAIDLLRKAGAQVDQGNLGRVPARLVETALASAPRRVTLYNREGQPAMPLEGRRCFFGPGSDCLNILDQGKGDLAIGSDHNFTGQLLIPPYKNLQYIPLANDVVLRDLNRDCFRFFRFLGL